MDGRNATAIFTEIMGMQRAIGTAAITWQPVLSLGWIERRNIPRYEPSCYRTSHNAELLAGGGRLHIGSQQTWYQPLFFGFELAYNHQPTQALSSPYEFVSTLGWQGRRFSFQLRHISNGGLHDPNRGETMALAGLGFTL
ncbi:acyloxyacyl hydrolase [Dyella telluris]|uniref:Acyloxyacyl hydrolase n=2 Tax=Dyella telluris TaxID=2763498 RepID=A0A7G8QAY4_9GAMM|nr:acyloxyacyl hydrolase [Dyella telluris]